MNLKLLLRVGLALAVLATVALAAIPRTRAIEHVSPESFSNLIIADPLKGTCSIDFGNLGGASTSTVSTCRESSCPVAAAVIGDWCGASSTYGADDGGTVLPEQARLGCKVTVAGTALIQICWSSSDAGSFDPGAGLYTARVIH